MRFLLVALFSLLCASCLAPREQALTPLDIVEIKPRYIAAAQFKRITEYLTGAEHQPRRLIMRSDASQRSGFYFTLILNQDVRDLPPGTVVEAQLFTPQSPDMQLHSFTLPYKRAKTREIFIGLTGADWPLKDAVPNAWRFTIKDPNGKLLATEQSYLWSL